MYSLKKIITIVLIPVILTVAACNGNEKNSEEEKAVAIPVTTAFPAESSANEINLSGSVVSIQTVNISTRIMGTVNRIYVKQGDAVHKGKLLATISSQDLQAKKEQANAAITEAEANFKDAQKDFERYTNLYNKQSATAKELDNITLQYNAAKSKVEAASQMRNEVNAMLAYSSLTAPFDGVITYRLADEGSMASPGMPLMTIEQNGKLQVAATVSELIIGKIKKESKAIIEIKAADKTIESQVSEINPSSQGMGGQYQVKFSIPDQQKGDLYPGMYANISIPLEEKIAASMKSNILLVPTSCLIHNDQLTGLYTISSNNTALLRWVRTGKIYGDKTEILSGIGTNEKFILGANGKLYDGVAVKEEKN